jgi:hypothetical protein
MSLCERCYTATYYTTSRLHFADTASSSPSRPPLCFICCAAGCPASYGNAAALADRRRQPNQYSSANTSAPPTAGPATHAKLAATAAAAGYTDDEASEGNAKNAAQLFAASLAVSVSWVTIALELHPGKFFTQDKYELTHAHVVELDKHLLHADTFAIWTLLNVHPAGQYAAAVSTLALNST